MKNNLITHNVDLINGEYDATPSEFVGPRPKIFNYKGYRIYKNGIGGYGSYTISGIDKKETYDFTNLQQVKDYINSLNKNKLKEAKQKTALKSNGVYSVMKDAWIKAPIAADIPEIDKEAFNKEFKVWEDRYNKIINSGKKELKESTTEQDRNKQLTEFSDEKTKWTRHWLDNLDDEDIAVFKNYDNWKFNIGDRVNISDYGTGTVIDRYIGSPLEMVSVPYCIAFYNDKYKGIPARYIHDAEEYLIKLDTPHLFKQLNKFNTDVYYINKSANQLEKELKEEFNIFPRALRDIADKYDVELVYAGKNKFKIICSKKQYIEIITDNLIKELNPVSAEPKEYGILVICDNKSKFEALEDRYNEIINSGEKELKEDLNNEKAEKAITKDDLDQAVKKIYDQLAINKPENKTIDHGFKQPYTNINNNLQIVYSIDLDYGRYGHNHIDRACAVKAGNAYDLWDAYAAIDELKELLGKDGLIIDNKVYYYLDTDDINEFGNGYQYVGYQWVFKSELKEDLSDAKSIVADQIKGEWEAIKNYRKAVDDLENIDGSFDNIIKILNDIADEEETHAGELETAANELDDKTLDRIDDGREEAEEKMSETANDLDYNNEIEESYADRQHWISVIKSFGKNYNFDKYSDQQLYKIAQRLIKTKENEDNISNIGITSFSPRVCDKCGHHLTDSGECPICDLGDESAADESLTESTVVKATKNISSTEKIELCWDKDKGWYIRKLSFIGPEDYMYQEDFVKTFNSEAAAKKVFSSYINNIAALTEELKNKKVKEIEKYLEDVYDMRKQAIAEDGEYSIKNLVFKELRNKGYLDNLRDLKIKLVDKDLSLESLHEDKNSDHFDFDSEKYDLYDVNSQVKQICNFFVKKTLSKETQNESLKEAYKNTETGETGEIIKDFKNGYVLFKSTAGNKYQIEKEKIIEIKDEVSSRQPVLKIVFADSFYKDLAGIKNKNEYKYFFEKDDGYDLLQYWGFDTCIANGKISFETIANNKNTQGKNKVYALVKGRKSGNQFRPYFFKENGTVVFVRCLIKKQTNNGPAEYAAIQDTANY